MGISRGLGETLAILMVSGNVVRMPENIFSSVRTLNANIALEMPYAVGIHRSSLFFSGIITFLFTLFGRLSLYPARVLRLQSIVGAILLLALANPTQDHFEKAKILIRFILEKGPSKSGNDQISLP